MVKTDWKNLASEYGINPGDATFARLYDRIKNSRIAGIGIAFPFLRKRFEQRASLYQDVLTLDRYLFHLKTGVPIGKFTYSQFGIDPYYRFARGLASIGAFSSIAHDLVLCEFNHPIDNITTHPAIYYQSRGFVSEDRTLMDSDKNQKVVICSDVWVGFSVTVLPSVVISDGAIIGAGSVVTKDVPPYAIVVGNPARILRYRFSPEQIENLLTVRWWEWDNKKIKENIDAISNPEVFFNRFGKSGKS